MLELYKIIRIVVKNLRPFTPEVYPVIKKIKLNNKIIRQLKWKSMMLVKYFSN